MVEAQSPVSGPKDVRSDGVGRPSRIAGGQAFKYRQVLAHGGNDVGFIEARLFPSEDPQLEKVHPVGRGDDRIPKKIDEGVMQFPIHALGLRNQTRAEAALAGGALEIGQDQLMFFSQLSQHLVGCFLGKYRCGLALEEKAELKGVANQLYVCVDHLHDALRYGDDKSFDFETGNQLSNGAQGQPGELSQLSLGKKLSRPDVSGEQEIGKAFVRLLPQFLGAAAFVS